MYMEHILPIPRGSECVVARFLVLVRSNTNTGRHLTVYFAKWNRFPFYEVKAIRLREVKLHHSNLFRHESFFLYPILPVNLKINLSSLL